MENSLYSSLKKINDKIEAAASKAGRTTGDVRLVAVTKTRPPEIVQDAFAEGLTHFGENKVQEARHKKMELDFGCWHLIGHLQKNKVREAVRLFDRIDSIDSAELARELSCEAEEAGKIMPVLMQVNVSGEASKFGVSPSAALELAQEINALPGLQLEGLMTMAPFFVEVEKTRPAFRGLRECRDQIASATGFHLPVLSMGMSHDFEVAIEEGSTEVRLGTALFGERKSKLGGER